MFFRDANNFYFEFGTSKSTGNKHSPRKCYTRTIGRPYVYERQTVLLASPSRQMQERSIKRSWNFWRDFRCLSEVCAQARACLCCGFADLPSAKSIVFGILRFSDSFVWSSNRIRFCQHLPPALSEDNVHINGQKWQYFSFQNTFTAEERNSK